MSWIGKKPADQVVSGQQLADGTISLSKLVNGIFTAGANGLAKFADGFFTADAAGRAKFADGFVTSQKLATGAARANFGAGAVLQVVSGSTSSSVTNSSSTWVGTGLSVTITPSSTSSKILLLVNLPFQNGSNNYVYNEFRLMRNGTQVYYTKAGNSVSAYVVALHVFHFSYIDAPASTSALTFTLDFRTSASSGEYGGEIFNPAGSANVPQIIAMEIAG